MKKILFLSAILGATALFTFTSCEDEARNRSSGNNSDAKENTLSEIMTPLKGGFELALNEKIEYENMVVYPITANDGFVEEHRQMGDYTTLKDAVASGKLVISEKEELPNYASENNNRSNVLSENTIITTNTNRAMGQARNNSSGPEVNALSVQNKGDDTVFIMAGELVRGGNQDRVVAEDLVVLPHSKKKDLPVFCVEHGRWTSNGYYQNNTNFGFTNNVVSSGIRKIVVKEKQQQAVWDKVADVTATNTASSETGTYNSLEESKDFTSKRGQYVDALENKFDKNEKVIGVIVTDKNNRVIGCDLFCKSKLFRKEFKGLIYSYTTEIISDEKKKEDRETISPEQYFAKVAAEYKSTEGKTEGGKFIYKGKVVHYSGF